MTTTLRFLPALAALASISACASLSQKEKGAIIGAASGAAVGAAVGNANGSTAKGAIIGAAVGGTAGAVIGHQMDQQAKEIKQEIPGAVVERVGEGLQVTFESGLLFPYDSDVLTAQARENLNTLASSLDKYPNTDIVVVGHTDAVGSDEYNLTLSERRANSAVNYLVSRGVSRARLRAAGRGESEPVAANETDAGRQQNRRVEVAIFANETLKAQAARQSGQ
jgi:outer membrane protein OmpA-like peptidoglycan-associated protein